MMDSSKCPCCKYKFGCVLWILSALALIAAWISGDGIFLMWGAGDWYWTALVLGVLALGCKMAGCATCANCKGGMCK